MQKLYAIEIHKAGAWCTGPFQLWVQDAPNTGSRTVVAQGELEMMRLFANALAMKTNLEVQEFLS